MKKIFFVIAALWVGLFAAHAGPASEHVISGKVISSIDGTPMIGASVLVKGTKEGTVTDLNGEFEITTKAKCQTLEISYAGFETVTIKKACVEKELLVELSPAELELEEVVITGRASGLRKAKRIRSAMDQAAYQTMGAPAPSSQGGYYDPGTPHNTEDYALIQENRFHRPADEPLSTFSIDVDAASYSNLRRFLRNGQMPPKDAVRIEEMVNYFNYDYPEPVGADPFTVTTEIASCPWEPDHRLLHIGLQGKHIPMDELPPSNLVFLIDVSGSMSAPNKLPLLKSAFKLLTDQLRKEDKVAIVVYAGAAGVVLKPTSGDNKRAIKDAIDQLESGGSTAGAAGIRLAYQLAKENFAENGNNRVVLATDGDFNVGTSSDADLVRLIEQERESGVFLTVLGFGMGNYKDNKMQQLADKGNGNHAYIDDIQEAKKVLVEEFGGTVFTIAKDVKLQIEFNPAEVAGYRLIGYENRLLNKEDFNDDKKDAGELGSGHTVTAIYELIPAGVESTYLAAVDPLKYQQPKVDRNTKKTGEVATIKLRYKQPQGSESKLLEEVIKDAGQDWENSTENFRWSAAVTGFGMLLRDSDYKSEATYASILKLAKSSRGEDEHGYRAECVRMIETVQSLADPKIAEKE